MCRIYQLEWYKWGPWLIMRALWLSLQGSGARYQGAAKHWDAEGQAQIWQQGEEGLRTEP